MNTTVKLLTQKEGKTSKIHKNFLKLHKLTK